MSDENLYCYEVLPPENYFDIQYKEDKINKCLVNMQQIFLNKCNETEKSEILQIEILRKMKNKSNKKKILQKK